MQLTLSEIIESLNRVNKDKLEYTAGALRDQLLFIAQQLEKVAHNVVP